MHALIFIHNLRTMYILRYYWAKETDNLSKNSVVTLFFASPFNLGKLCDRIVDQCSIIIFQNLTFWAAETSR